VGCEGGVPEFQGEEVAPLETERPEIACGGRDVSEGAEDEARDEAARGVDGEAGRGRGRGREACDEGLHLSGGRRGVIWARAEEEHDELRRGRGGRLRGAITLVVGLVLRFVVAVAVAVVVRRAEGTAVLLRSAHGCGGDGEGSGWRRWFRGFKRFWIGRERWVTSRRWETSRAGSNLLFL
jgi:hypothetical protein